MKKIIYILLLSLTVFASEGISAKVICKDKFKFLVVESQDHSSISVVQMFSNFSYDKPLQAIPCLPKKKNEK